MKASVIKSICIVSFLMFLGFSCSNEDYGNPNDGAKVYKATELIYYIDGTGNNFAQELEKLRLLHPELKLVTVTSNNTGGYGSTVGYFVIFEKK